MRNLFSLVAGAILLLGISPAFAQVPNTGRVVSSCGTPGITYTAGAFGPVTVDTNGNVCFNGSGGGGTTTNITEWASVALGAPSNYGTSPGAVAVPGVNAFITNAPTVNQGTAGSASSAWYVQPGTGAIFPIAGNTTPTIANGNGVVSAPSSEASAGLSTGASSTLASNLVVKGSAGNLYSFNVSADSTLSGAAWWLMIFNATTLPADGTVTPAKCYAFPPGTTSYSAAFSVPVAFSAGIVLGVSTTGCFTKTASVHAFLSGDYK